MSERGRRGGDCGEQRQHETARQVAHRTPPGGVQRARCDVHLENEMVSLVRGDCLTRCSSSRREPSWQGAYSRYCPIFELPVPLQLPLPYVRNFWARPAPSTSPT